MVVTDDADLERATADAVTAALSNSGQACVSLQRIYVTRGVAERFVTALAERGASVCYGDRRKEDTIVGPLISIDAAEKLKGSIDAAVAGGARVLAGGEVVEGVLQPTVLTEVDESNVLVCEEAFGPVVDDLRRIFSPERAPGKGIKD